jgi:hypothetical protein
MKIKITLFLLCFCYFQNCFSQNIKGEVKANDLPIQNVEVINISNKDVVNTNAKGVFEIKATKGNWISFYHKDYEVVKIYVDSLFDYSKSLEINLSVKTIKIEEVIVEKKQPFLKGLKTGMPVLTYNKPVTNFSDGTVYTGFDFNKIGQLLIDLFGSEKEVVVTSKKPISFRAFTSQSYDSEFLVKSLKLELEDIEMFLNFCSFDPKSNTAVENSDKLILLQFLIEKSVEFKKVYEKK